MKQLKDDFTLQRHDSTLQNINRKGLYIWEERIAKRIDRFLINEGLLNTFSHFRKLVREVGNSDNFSIFMDIFKDGQRTLSALKFNACWLEEEEYTNMIKISRKI